MEASCYHQTYVFAKSSLSSLPPSLLSISSRNFLQSKLNVLVAMVRKGDISARDAAVIVHGIGCLLPPLRPLVTTPPPNTVLIRGMRRSVTRSSLVATFERFGGIMEAEVAPGKGFGFVRFTGQDGIRRTTEMYGREEVRGSEERTDELTMLALGTNFANARTFVQDAPSLQPPL